MEIIKEEDLKYILKVSHDELCEVHYALCERLANVARKKQVDSDARTEKLITMINKLEVLF